MKYLADKDNFWLGPNELIICFRNGTYHVHEKFEDYAEVFTGNYDNCWRYCTQRYEEYLREIIG